jgi:hypothetical protein
MGIESVCLPVFVLGFVGLVMVGLLIADCRLQIVIA